MVGLQSQRPTKLLLSFETFASWKYVIEVRH